MEDEGAARGPPGEAARPLRDDEQELVAEEADDVVGDLPRAPPTQPSVQRFNSNSTLLALS